MRKILGSSAPSQQKPQHNDEEEQREKQFIADFEDNKAPLSPKQIAKDPRNKRLGASSRQLRLEDFELLKTLGTGMAMFTHLWTTEGCFVLMYYIYYRDFRARMVVSPGKAHQRGP